MDTKKIKQTIIKIVNRFQRVLIAAVIVVAGAGFVCCLTYNESEKANLVDNSKIYELPSAGASGVVEQYVSRAGELSMERLSTTALAAGLEGYNEYYDADGRVFGKHIVYANENSAQVYNVIPQYKEEFVKDENGGQILASDGSPARRQVISNDANVVGILHYGDVVTLLNISDDYWYRIVSDSVDGYVRIYDDSFAMGKDAEALDGITYESKGVVVTNGAFIYESDDSDSAILCCMGCGMEVDYADVTDYFTYVTIEGLGGGWIANGDLQISNVRKYATSVEEQNNYVQRVAAGIEEAAEIEGGRDYQRYLDERYGNVFAMEADSSDIASLRSAIANYACQFAGWLPYVWGGNSLSEGTDCSGFTSLVYAEYGYEIPRSSGEQSYGGVWVPMSDIREGDIVCYSGHVAMYVGDGMVVHELNEGAGCVVTSMYIMSVDHITRYIY